MFRVILRKELKAFFSNKGNLVFMVFLPILLISIFSFALGDYMQADYNTFDNGRVLYFIDTSSQKQMANFDDIAAQITDVTGVVFESVSNLADAEAQVQASEAYGVVTITDSEYEYYRSPFNESEGGKLVRSLFVQLSENAGKNDEKLKINHVVLTMTQPNSKAYYSFSALAFSLLFMGLLIAHSVFDEKAYGTITRIRLSKAGVRVMLLSKILTGVICGGSQILTAYLFSSLLLGVQWGSMILWIVLLFLLLAIYSAVFGAFIGMLAKNKSICQSAVMMTSMLCGYLGGSITPLYLLENMPVLRTLVKVSPLYWINRATTSLTAGILNKYTLYSVLVLLGLSCLLLILYTVSNKKIPNMQSSEVKTS